MKARLLTGFIAFLLVTLSGSCSFSDRTNENDPKSSRYRESGITVNQAGNPILKDDEFVFSTTQINTANTLEFTIVNTGGGDLILNGTPRVAIEDDIAGYYDIMVQPASKVASGGSTTFTLRFSPLALGNHTAAVTISSDDPDDNNFVFFLTAECTSVPVSEINVKQGISDIISGGTVDFGSVVQSTAKTLTITIENTGNAGLTVSEPSKSGTDAALFTIDTVPASSIAGGGTSTFNITFAPVSTGIKTASLTITNSDSDEGTYTFTITGTGMAAAAPEINVVGGATNIADGGSLLFGSAKQGETLDITFTVQNLGTANLTLTGTPKVAITGTNASLFTIKDGIYPSSPIAASGSSTFTVTFAPSATDTAGTKTATISISNDDTDENTYSFTITAACVEWYGKKNNYIRCGQHIYID